MDSTMPQLRRAIPTIRTTSIDEALPFYEALGFEVAWQHRLEREGARLTSLVQGDVELFLTEHAVAPVGAVVYIVLDRIDDLVARARARLLEPSFGPQDQPWGNREAYFTDPDSNVLRFGQPGSKASE